MKLIDLTSAAGQIAGTIVTTFILIPSGATFMDWVTRCLITLESVLSDLSLFNCYFLEMTTEKA